MIEAKVIAASKNAYTTKEIVTFELDYPRFIHCFDEETEILSQINNEQPLFRSFPAVFALGAKVAEYDADTEEIRFTVPTETVEYQHTGEMVYFDKNKLSMSVTNGHRVFTKKRTTHNKFINNVILAENLLDNYGTVRIPKAGFFKASQKLSNEEICLIAWFVADGHLTTSGKAQFHFRKDRKVSEVLSLLYKLGIDSTQKVYEKDGVVDYVITFNAPAWASDCYDSEGTKQFPKYATDMTQDCYVEWKRALMLSDGNLERCTYNSTSPAVAETVQVVSLLHGDAMNIRSYGQNNSNKRLYKQTWADHNYISLRADKDIFETREYDGKVYCVSVPTSFIVVRRKGIAYVSGNCELMTHRMFSRNAQSSRAVPVSKTLEVNQDWVKPITWGKNKPGMSSTEELDGVFLDSAKELWDCAAKSAFVYSEQLANVGLHKQYVNRITEPFSRIKVVITATELDNFFWLRNDPDAAQPEIVELAQKMQKAFNAAEFVELTQGQWHLPYVKTVITPKGGQLYFDSNGNELTEMEAVQISASCCAQVSYRKLDDSKEKALQIYDRLFSGPKPHLSPIEHQAQAFDPDKAKHYYPWPKGITHQDRNGNYWSGNFADFIQYRQLLTQD